MSLIDWIIDNSALIVSSIPTTILFIAYYKLNKRQKEAEVKQTEAGAKHTEADALTNMQAGYAQWTKDADKKFTELKGDINELKREGQRKDFIISDLTRKISGLQRFDKELKQSLTEVEMIACIKMDCLTREPKLGEYKHKKKA